jgi:O-6-methylguanine DNA methyltransferase
MGELLYQSVLQSPIGPLELIFTEIGLAAIELGEGKLDRWVQRTFPDAVREPAEKRHQRFENQIRQYFDGRRRVFDIPLDLRGSDFQKVVWEQVARIPYGRTASYGEIAHLLGRPRASRAVGAANGANPVPIVVPCHRVIGANGSLTGYGGGLVNKRWLLAHEGVLRAGPVQMGLFRKRPRTKIQQLI